MSFSINYKRPSSAKRNVIEQRQVLDDTCLIALGALQTGATAKDVFALLAENQKRSDVVTNSSIGRAKSVFAGVQPLTTLTAVSPLQLVPASILMELKNVICVEPDAGIDKSRLQYSLVAGTGDTDNASFVIDERANLQAVDSALAAGSYSVRVQGIDPAGNTAEVAVAVTVVEPTSLNNPPSPPVS